MAKKNNLKTASKKSIYEAKVAQLDSFGTDIQQFFNDESLSIVEDILGDFILRVQENINTQVNMVTTGEIADITLKPENDRVSVLAPAHLLYQNFGVSGVITKVPNSPFKYTDKKPPASVFKEWIKRKNINLVSNETYYGEPSPFKKLTEDAKINSAAYGMRENVYKHGFKARNIYSKEIPQLIEELQEQIAGFAVQSIVQVIDVANPATKRVILPKK